MKLMSLLEGFVSNLTNLSTKDLQKVYEDEYGTKIEFLYSAFWKLDKTTDAKYLFVTYDDEDELYLVSEIVVVSQNGKLKMVSHSPVPLKTGKSLSATRTIISGMVRRK